LPIARTTTSPEFNPTRIFTTAAWDRLTSSAYRFTLACMSSAA
jgi:hypothetical protein